MFFIFYFKKRVEGGVACGFKLKYGGFTILVGMGLYF